MFVAASTGCFPDLPLPDVMERLAGLEYTNIEIQLHESGVFRPSDVASDVNRAAILCRTPHCLTAVAYSVELEIPPSEEYYRRWKACCLLARATQVGTLVTRASALGTPFNEEIERLRKMTAIATENGLVVGLVTETGRMTERPDTATDLCNYVPGLRLTLDPSYYHSGAFYGVNYDALFKYTCHVRLRDSTKEKFQVRIGQGIIEYGRIVSMLEKYRYNRALCADFVPLSDIDQNAELRKMRLLLESLL